VLASAGDAAGGETNFAGRTPDTIGHHHAEQRAGGRSAFSIFLPAKPSDEL